MTIPPILCVAGGSGTGKTQLLERLIGRLRQNDLRVAAIKHCQHVDQGRASSKKDSARLARAGAEPAIAAGPGGLEVPTIAHEPSLLDLAAMFCRHGDLVLAEGYSQSVHDKILLEETPEEAQRPRHVESVRLVVGPGAGRPGRDDVDDVAEWVLTWLRRRLAAREGLTAAVLAGGSSRRMGKDKSRLKIADQSVLARLCELLADRFGQVTIVGGRPQGQEMPLWVQWHPDVTEGLGPLGGIATALRLAAGGDRPRGVCLVACDMPLVTGDLLDHLLSGRLSSGTARPATVLINPRTTRAEPLPGIYESHARPSVEKALDSGRLSVTDWLNAAGAHRLSVPDELAGLLANINTHDQLKAMRLQIEQSDW